MNDDCRCRPYWVADRTTVADCPVGTSGASVTRTVQRRSTISLEHAQALALHDSQADALAALVCTPVTVAEAEPAGLGLLWE